jgi:NAD(P)-dependent dehydrogenase (short-subunit alcohol dehydrogenase family)
MAKNPRDAFDITGRVAIITGGGRGLGKAMSVGLAVAGARVVAVGRTQPDIDEIVATIRAEGGDAVGVRADIADYAALPGIVQTAVDEFGGIDILVNNAAYSAHVLVADLTPEFADRFYRINVHGPTFLAQAALPYLQASGRGTVINVTSGVIWNGSTGSGPYRASKAALQHMSRTMAKEWAPTVRVNTLAPGAFESSYGGGWPEEASAFMGSRIPLGRIGRSSDVVPPLLYLASDASAFVTGTDLVVDGGSVNGKGDPSTMDAVAAMTERDEAHQLAVGSVVHRAAAEGS